MCLWPISRFFSITIPRLFPTQKLPRIFFSPTHEEYPDITRRRSLAESSGRLSSDFPISTTQFPPISHNKRYVPTHLDFLGPQTSAWSPSLGQS